MPLKDFSVSSDRGSLSSISPRPSLLRRVSSFLASIPSRGAMPQRTETAPNLENPSPARWMWFPFQREFSSSSLAQELRAPTVEICPNDPEVYYFFPPFEHEQCDCNSVFCGLCRNDRCRPFSADWPSGATENIRRCSLSRPCTPSRAGQPCAHLAMDQQAVLNMSRRRNSRFSGLAYEPPRNARIPSSSRGTVHAGAGRVAVPEVAGFRSRPPTRRGPVPESERGSTFESLLRRPYSPASNPRETPSPKLHHFLGNESHPYVRRHEAESFLFLTGSAATEPFTTSERGSHHHTRSGSDASQYYADTVYYPPRSPSPHPATPPPSVQRNTYPLRPYRSPPTSSAAPAAHTSAPRISSPLLSVSGIESVHASGSVTVDRDGQPISFDLELETTDVYRIHRERRSHGDDTRTHHGGTAANDNSGSSADTRNSSATETFAQTPSTIGGRRLELRGGAPCVPRLRGGGSSGSESRVSISSIGKRLRDIFWTCGGNCNVPDPDDDLPSSRPKLNYANPLSNGDARAAVPFWKGGLVTPVDQRYTPRLRGGGKPEETKCVVDLKDDGARIPFLTWFLAGGTCAPITAGQWRKRKPRKRMGGLVGMAIYGHKAGMPYDDMQEASQKPQGPKEEEPGELYSPNGKSVHGITVQAPGKKENGDSKTGESDSSNDDAVSAPKDAESAAASATGGEEPKNAVQTLAPTTPVDDPSGEEEKPTGPDDTELTTKGATRNNADEGEKDGAVLENASSENTTPGEPAPRQPTAEETPLESPAPENSTPNQTISNGATPSGPTPTDLDAATLENATSEDASPGNSTPEDATPKNAVADNAAPEKPTAEKQSAEGTTSEHSTSDNETAGNATPEEPPPADPASADPAPENAPSNEATPNGATPNESDSDETPPNDTSPNATTSKHTTSDDETPCNPSQQDAKPNDATENVAIATQQGDDAQKTSESVEAQEDATEHADSGQSQSEKDKCEEVATRDTPGNEGTAAKDDAASPSSESSSEGDNAGGGDGGLTWEASMRGGGGTWWDWGLLD